MRTLRYFLTVLIGTIAVIAVFIAFHPESPPNKYNIWEDLKSFKPVSNRIKNAVEDRGLYKVIVFYVITAPVFEEVVYRGPLWLLCLIFGLMGFNQRWEKNFLLWPVLVIPAFTWALLHPYPPIYQAFVFTGGMFNGACIAYLMEKKWSRASIFGSLVLVIYMHSLLNLFVVLLVQIL